MYHVIPITSSGASLALHLLGTFKVQLSPVAGSRPVGKNRLRFWLGAVVVWLLRVCLGAKRLVHVVV